jgi:cellulose biosynthesis protein BcsQ
MDFRYIKKIESPPSKSTGGEAGTVAVIAVTGRKGGIGKSSLSANLGVEFAALGSRVAMLDTDPQQSLVAWAGLGTGLLAQRVQAVDTTQPERFRATVAAAQ